MAKKTNQEIADAAFDTNKDLNELFVADGFVFSTENAANLHKHSSGKKGIKIFPFTRKETVLKAVVEPKPVKLDKLNKAALIKVAESKGIRPEENATKAQIIEQIEIVLNSETVK
jgi:hypothetical protein